MFARPMLATYRRLLGTLRPHAALFALAFASMVLLGAATSASAFLAGPLLRYLVSGGAESAGLRQVFARVPGVARFVADARLAAALPWLLVGVGVVRGAGYLGQFFCMGLVGQRVVADLRRALHAKLLGLSPSFFSASSTGDLLSRFGSDVSAVEYAVTYGIAAYVRDTLQVAFLLALSFVLDWRLALFTFVAVPVTIVPVVRFAKRLKAIASQGQEQIGRLWSALHEAIAGVRIVQAFGMERYERERFERENARLLAIMRKSFLVRAAFTPTLELLGIVAFALGVGYATRAIAAGTLSSDKLVSFASTVLLMYQPLKSLGGVGQFMTQGLAGAERLFATLDTAPEIVDAPDATPCPPFARELAFEGVGFRYRPREGSGDDSPVVRSISLTVKRGEVVALVGASGAGKTTLASLLFRFYDPTEGRVTLDGADLRALTVASVRAQIALVAQESFLFNDTIRANIAYGRPDVDDARVREAARAARAEDFILAMPRGYDTIVGERGATLSGGQRQRLAIARALLKDAPILVLDEATSSLDADNEREVQRALARLMERRTTLVIAHRLSTVRHADRICVMADGALVEQGTHDALLARGGEYARLCRLQLAPDAESTNP